MKRLIVIFLLLALAATAQATNLNFQNPTDNTSVIAYQVGSPVSPSYYWSESTTGGNNFIHTSAVATGGGTWKTEGVYTMLPSASSTTYAASTFTSTSYGAIGCGGVLLLDSSRNTLWMYPSQDTTYWRPASGSRIEFKYTGGSAYIFDDGGQVATKVIATTPSYVGFGSDVCAITGASTVTVDDYVFGQTENMWVLGIPESDNDAFIILQDVGNSAADGLYNTTSHTQTDANYMSSTWSRGNTTLGADVAQPNKSVNLVNFATGTVYDTQYTGTGYSGTIVWNIKTKLLDVNAPDGFYAITVPGSGKYSNLIAKRSNGASVSWSSKHYNVADTGSVITVISNGGYFDPSIYSYKLAVMDVYGIYHGPNTTITTQTATVTHSWNAATDNPGVYYAVMYATRVSDGQEYIFGYDWTELTDNAGYAGYVVNAQTGASISGAMVNFTQDGTSSNGTSLADGTYNATGFITGMRVNIDAHATGFEPYNYSWIPLAARTVSGLNISMEPSLPSYSGLAIGGVARDSTAYGRPIANADVTIRNTTLGTYCVMFTNNWGWYTGDGAVCSLQAATHYDVWGHKIGFDNSTVYNVLTGGL